METFWDSWLDLGEDPYVLPFVLGFRQKSTPDPDLRNWFGEQVK